MISKIRLIFTLLFVTCFGYTYAQYELIDKVEPQPGKAIISYEKYKLLSNDLTLIIHEDHSDPIVHVEVAYHVGSARESVRNSGFAHFFEHMMFQGSKNVADEEHFKMISTAGGTNNAFTAFDKTVYINTAPSNFTESLLWLEADRMATLLDGFTQAKFESQRNAVKNEKKQSYDNQPYGMLSEVLFKTMFANQTYEWTPIGYTDDLDIATYEDLRAFFLRWYKPNNATVVVSGDVNPENVKLWVNRYFGTIKKGDPVRNARPFKPILSYDQYVEIPDNIYLPLTLMAWPTVPEFHKDEKALEVLAYVLAGNNSSPFYKKFVETEDAVQASASNSSLELSGFIEIDVVAAYGGLTTKEVEARIREVLNEFESKGVSAEEVNKAKVVFKTRAINVMDGVQSKALELSHWHMMLDKKYNLNDQIAAIESVTPEDVMNVYRKYIKDKNCIIINVVPEQKQAEEGDEENKPGKSVNPHANEKKVVDPQYTGLVYEAPVDDFDRSVKPKPQKVSEVKLPEYYQTTFDNGLKVIGTETNESPKVIVYFTIQGGQLLEGNKYPTGTASITAEMMTEGTETLTSEEFQNKLDNLGSTIRFSSGDISTTCYVSTLRKNLDETLRLVEDALFHPRFDAKDFKRIKKQTLEGIQSNKRNPSVMADIAYNQILFKGTLIEDAASGNFKSVSKIKLDDVKDYYKNYYSPKVTSLVISGDISKNEALQSVEFMKKWEAKDVVIPEIGKLPEMKKVQIYLIDKPYAPQSVITFAQHHIPFDYDGDYFKTSIMYFPLGGNFNSRLTMNIREEHGFAYSPQSAFWGNKYYGGYFWQADVRTNATDSAVREVMKEITKYKAEGITDDELAFTKSSLLLRDALKYESPNQKATFLDRIVTYNLPKDYVKQEVEIINQIKKEEVNAIAQRVLKPESISIIIVGNAYKVRKSLNDLGYGKIKEIKLD
ncbi:MAG: insulinase family protein, partial [Flavobacteriales bacterium]|nr:insulinase family protein [Flavobacteriales bacterium]